MLDALLGDVTAECKNREMENGTESMEMEQRRNLSLEETVWYSLQFQRFVALSVAGKCRRGDAKKKKKCFCEGAQAGSLRGAMAEGKP